MQATHMDAPWHFHPTQDQGKPALTIDKFPLEWGVGRGMKLDFSDFPDGYNITVGDVKAKLDKLVILSVQEMCFLRKAARRLTGAHPNIL